MGQEIQTTEVTFVTFNKEYFYIDEVSEISIHDDYVELHLKRRDGHIWIGHPIDLPQLCEVRSIFKGDWVRIDFVQNGYGAVGVHRILEIRKATLDELKLRAEKEPI